jgi:hypothetical protein
MASDARKASVTLQLQYGSYSSDLPQAENESVKQRPATDSVQKGPGDVLVLPNDNLATTHAG